MKTKESEVDEDSELYKFLITDKKNLVDEFAKRLDIISEIQEVLFKESGDNQVIMDLIIECQKLKDVCITLVCRQFGLA
jgi:hypothetical protein